MKKAVWLVIQEAFQTCFVLIHNYELPLNQLMIACNSYLKNHI